MPNEMEQEIDRVQKRHESRSGNVQVLDLGSVRTRFSIVLPFLSEDDKEDLFNFLSKEAPTNWNANYTGASNPQVGGVKYSKYPFTLTFASGWSRDVRLIGDIQRARAHSERWRYEFEVIDET